MYHSTDLHIPPTVSLREDEELGWVSAMVGLGTGNIITQDVKINCEIELMAPGFHKGQVPNEQCRCSTTVAVYTC